MTFSKGIMHNVNCCVSETKCILAYLLVFIHEKHKTANKITIKIVMELVVIPATMIMVPVESIAADDESKWIMVTGMIDKYI